MVRELTQKNKLLALALIFTSIRLVLYCLEAKSMFIDFFDIIINITWFAAWVEYIQRLLKTKLGIGNLPLSVFLTILTLGGTVSLFIGNMYVMFVFYQNYIQ